MRDVAVANAESVRYVLPAMADLWNRWSAAIRAHFSAVRWVEPGNAVTRTVLQSGHLSVLLDGPLYSRDPRDLVFTIDQLLHPAPPAASAPQGEPDTAASAKRAARRRAGRAA